MREYLRFIVILGLFGVVAGLMIGILHQTVHGFAGNNVSHQIEPVLLTLQPPGSMITESTPGVSKWQKQWTVRRDSLVIAHIVALKTADRTDSVAFMVSVDTAGNILGFRWLGTQRAPLVAATVSQNTHQLMIWDIFRHPAESGPSPFELQFNGISVLRPINIHLVRMWPMFNQSEAAASRAGNIIYAIDGHGESVQRIVNSLSSIGAEHLNLNKRQEN